VTPLKTAPLTRAGHGCHGGGLVHDGRLSSASRPASCGGQREEGATRRPWIRELGVLSACLLVARAGDWPWARGGSQCEANDRPDATAPNADHPLAIQSHRLPRCSHALQHPVGHSASVQLPWLRCSFCRTKAEGDGGDHDNDDGERRPRLPPPVARLAHAATRA